MDNNKVFIAIDFSENRDNIDECLDKDNMEMARKESQKILNTQNEIKKMVKSVGGKTIFESLVNLMVWGIYDEEFIEALSDTYFHNFGTPTNLGVGRTPLETNKSLETVEGGRKGNVVVSSKSIQEDLAANREFYKVSEKSRFDLKIANVIKAALLELNIITTEDKVYNIFMKLAGENSLDTIEQLQSFFYRPLEELKQNIRDIYEKRLAGGKMQSFPGNTVIPKSKRQKSPHKRLNWLTIEQYNEDSVDYGKTDVQYVGGNQTKDSQEFSMGGEPGESIATT